MHSCAVAHHQKLRCRSLAKVPMTLLKVVKQDYDVFNRCHKVFRNLPQNRPEPSVLDSMIVRYKVPYLDGSWSCSTSSGYLAATMALYVSRDTRELLGSIMPHLGGPSRPAASTVGCTLRDSKLFWCSGDQQDR